MTTPYRPPTLPTYSRAATTQRLMDTLNEYYDVQEADEHPPLVASRIRNAIDVLEKELRFRRSR